MLTFVKRTETNAPRFPKRGGKESKMTGKSSCKFQGNIYPSGGVICIEDQCIQCSDGRWESNEFERDLRARNLIEAML